MNKKTKIISLIVGWRLALFLFAYLATFVLPLIKRFTANEYGNLPYFLWIWGRFDGYFYMSIAQKGYQFFEQGYFPFYPIVIHLFASGFQRPAAFIIAGQFISIFSFLLSLYIIYKLLKLDYKKVNFVFFLSIILFFPTSIFYVAVYNDSLFLLLASLTLYFARRRKWTTASLFGTLAAFTRLNGLALVPFILFEYVLVSKHKFLSLKRIIKSKIYSVILIPLGFVGYLIYLHFLFGKFNSLFISMKLWNQDKLTFPPQVVWRYIKIFTTADPHLFIYWVAVLEFLFVLFYVFMLIYSYKKIRLSYWVFFAISILIPSLTGTFQGIPRYGLHLYPLFLSLAIFLEKKGIAYKTLYFIIGIGLLFFFTTCFTRGYFAA